jgi:hypothetical protein
MISEGKAVSDGDYVPFVLGVVVSEHLEDFYLDLPLFVQLLIVFEYL